MRAAWVLLAVGCAGGGAPDGAAPPEPGGGGRDPAAAVASVAPSAGGGAFHATPDVQLVGEVSASPRNILLVSLDTVRADRLGVYGGRAETPAMDALAARGVRFDHAISHFPETCLSHWSMMSGVMPEVHGNTPAHGGSVYAGPTMAEIAQSSGFATAAFIGGVTLTDASCGLARGFDRYDDQFPVDPTDMRRPGGQVTAAAMGWIGAQPGPWFAFVHYFDAHFPYTPPPPWDTRYDPDYAGVLSGSDADLRAYRDGGKTPSDRDLAHILALYDGELSELDALVAPLLDSVGEDTVVLVTADHGESFEHGYYFNHRAGLWDSVTHVPLLVRAPGVTPGQTRDAQVGLIDVAPTALSLAGLPVDARMQGRSLLGADAAEGGRETVYSITDPWMPDPQFAARTAQHKLIERDAGDLVYDLIADPQERASLGETPASLTGARAEYDAAIDALRPLQVTPPSQREVSAEERARLEALGYLVPGAAGPGGGSPGNGPPGPPPGGARGQGQGPPGPPPNGNGGPAGPAPGQPGGPPR